MRKVLALLAHFILFVLVAYTSIWGGLAIWFRLPGSDVVRVAVASAFILLGVATLFALSRPFRWRWLSLLSVVLLVVLGWWNTLAPPTEGNWSPELARQVTGRIDGDILTLENVRAFEWQTEEQFVEHWESRSYDISTIQSVDLLMSYWGGPLMAHFMLSFGFENGDYLTWSIEVRRRDDDVFSPITDFFKEHPLAIVASEESDVVGLRSNIQKADVHMFRLRLSPEKARSLIEAYVEDANAITSKPQWFNSVFTNCSRTAILLARHAGANLPADIRVIVNGYFPNYLYQLGVLNTDYTIEELYDQGDISESARAVGLTREFSDSIRKRVPKP